jgi:hypothetical protein
MIGFFGAKSSHLAVVGKVEIVPATGQLELFCNRGGIPAGLVRRTFPIAMINESLAGAVGLVTEPPPVSDQPEHRSFEPAENNSGLQPFGL